jgi:hypothetical protein
MYTSVDFTSQIVGQRGSLVPQTRGSHTSIWCGLVVTLKIDFEKVAKYGIGKRSVGLVFTNILKFVIDIPLPGRIFSACFWTSCVGIVSVTVSSRILLINDNLYGIIMFL